jgi:hypothetical protein
MRPVRVPLWRSRLPDGVCCAHFPIVDQTHCWIFVVLDKLCIEKLCSWTDVSWCHVTEPQEKTTWYKERFEKCQNFRQVCHNLTLWWTKVSVLVSPYSMIQDIFFIFRFFLVSSECNKIHREIIITNSTKQVLHSTLYRLILSDQACYIPTLNPKTSYTVM